MSDPGFVRRKQLLLDKFLAGEIDQATYDRLLADLHEIGSATNERPGTVVPVPEAPSSPSFAVTESHTAAERSAMSQPVPLLEPGTELGGFQLQRRLRRGGMGDVWQAHDPTAERSVVIKLLPPELQRNLDEMSRVKQTFHRVHNLQHQYICPVYLLGQDSRFGYFIVMKYLDGDTLSAYRKAYVNEHGSFPLPEVIRVLQPIANALDYAHGRQIIHRDIKPQNIMLSADGQDVQLVDFGLAAEVRTSVMRISHVQMETCGTYPYMAPEQWRGELQDARTDQYALAVVAFELLAGRLPFEATDPTVLRMCALNDEPPAVDGVPKSVNVALTRGMAKSRDDRFKTCADFLNALKAADAPMDLTAERRISGQTSTGKNEATGIRPVGISTKSFKSPGPSLSTDRGQQGNADKQGSSVSPRGKSFRATSPTKASNSRHIDDDSDLDDLEIVDADAEESGVRGSGSRSKSNRPTASRTSTRNSSTESSSRGRNRGEDALKSANARAMFWVSMIATGVCTSVVGLFCFMAWILWSNAGSMFGPAAATSPVATPNGANQAQVVPSEAPVAPSTTNSNPPNATKPAQIAPGNGNPVAPNGQPDAQLRYAWVHDKPYVYSVNVEMEPEEDVILSMAGSSTYTRGQPIAGKNDEAGAGKGTGTGFVIHSNGYLITCQHVVENASEIEVAISGKTFTGTVVTEDIDHDLAVIRIDTKGLPALTLANSDTVQLGEEVRAIGFPFSSILGANVKATRGTISGINQEDGRKVFQVDAGINPGNSGGPLVNERGEVVGVNFAKLREEVATNVGFAVPINDAMALLRNEKVPFTSGIGNGPKLEGPDLVKKVSAATALITVTTGGAARELHHYELKCTASLSSSVRSKSGKAIDENAVRNKYRSSLVEQGFTEPDVVEMDGLGRVHDVTGPRKTLPAFLGSLSTMVLERLPSIRRPSWATSFPITVVISEHNGEAVGAPNRLRPRFRPPGFPNLPGMPRNEPKVTRFPGTIRIKYTLVDGGGPILKIKKDFELEAREDGAKLPRVHLKGSGHFQFDSKTGIPRGMEFTAVLIENEPKQSTKLPIKLTYQLREQPGDAANAPAANVPPVNAPPVNAPVVAVPVEPIVAVPAEVPRNLSREEIDKCVEDLKSSNVGRATLAAMKLRNAVPIEDRRDQVLQALEAMLTGKDQFRRKSAIDAMATWAKPETVPVLIKCLEESSLLVKLAAIEALGKLKDERAAEPLARLVTEPGPRIAAISALRLLGSKAEKAVLELLKDTESSVRFEACRLLKDIGTTASEASLMQAAQDSDRVVANMAKDALTAIAMRK